MQNEKTFWCLWSGWNPEKLENWLEDRELNGWNLTEVRFSSVSFRFREGPPRRIRYAVDFQLNPRPEYFQILYDDDWELIWTDWMGWCLWRQPYCERAGRPVLSDRHSLM